MAEGVRIRHRTVRNATVVIRDLGKRGPGGPKGWEWPGCSVCHLPSPGHEGYKTRHITVDANGETTVVEGIWEALKRFIDHGGFEAIGVHRNPPPVRMSMNNGLLGPRGQVLAVVDREQTR